MGSSNDAMRRYALQNCPPGHWCGGDGSKTACPAGTYSPYGASMSASDCIPCPPVGVVSISTVGEGMPHVACCWVLVCVCRARLVLHLA